MRNLIHKFLVYLEVEKNVSEHTLRNYHSDLEQFRRFLGNEATDMFMPGRKDVRGFIVDLKKRGCAASTIARKIAALRSFFNFMVEEGYCASNPASGLTTPRTGKTLPSFVDENLMTRVLEAPAGDTVTGLRDRAILETLYSAGLRVSELVSLDYDSVDFIGGSVRVSGKGRNERIVPVGKKALTAINEYRKMDGKLYEKHRRDIKQSPEALFVDAWGGRLSSRSVCRTFNSSFKICKRSVNRDCFFIKKSSDGC